MASLMVTIFRAIKPILAILVFYTPEVLIAGWASEVLVSTSKF